MKRLIRWGTIPLCLLSVEPLSAQSIDEDLPPLQPGLHLSAKESKESMLAKAARMGGSVVIGEEDDEEIVAVTPSVNTSLYTVQEGDTLWGICERLFNDGYTWPRIWSYNPNITNPNWIYPGAVLRLNENASDEEALVAPREVTAEIAETLTMPEGALLVRSRGFIDKEGLKQSGTIVGAHKEVKWLSQYDEAYVNFPNASPRPGDTFSAFEVIKEVDIDDEGSEIGKLVEIKGRVKITSFDEKSHIARVVIDEACHPLPRGTLIGPVHKNLSMIPPVKNATTINGHLIAFLDPVVLAANHQVVFIDRGEKHGVKDGNRFFAVEKRDGLRRINEEPNDMAGYPTEVIAEMRVIETRPATATCLITSAVRELEVGQAVEMRAGY